MTPPRRLPTIAPKENTAIVFPLANGSVGPANLSAQAGRNAVAQAQVPIRATEEREIPSRTKRRTPVLKISRSGSPDARRADSCHRFDSGKKAKMNKARKAGVAQVATIQRQCSGVTGNIIASEPMRRKPQLAAEPIAPESIGRKRSGQH